MNIIKSSGAWLSNTFIEPYRGEGTFKKICGVVCALTTAELVVRAAKTCFALLSGNPADMALRTLLSFELGGAICAGLCAASVLPGITKIGGSVLTGIGYCVYLAGLPKRILPTNLLVFKVMGKVFSCAHTIIAKTWNHVVVPAVDHVVVPVFNHVVVPVFKHIVIPVFRDVIIPLAKIIASVVGKIFCHVALPSNPLWIIATAIVLLVIARKVFTMLSARHGAPAPAPLPANA